ncbi:hypothetical protein GGD67_002699 [Bradyrhizobium sp. IAR9]|nr:hypothetical protein [Bradyrhizobium sp. IAR9]
MNEAGPSSSAAPEEAVDVSFAAPQRFSHGSQIAPDFMVERLFHQGLLPDSDQPTMTYEIRGHRYTAGLDGSNRVLLVHNPAEDQVVGVGRAGVPDFGAFFTEHRRFGTPLPQQWATPALMDKLREEGFMPTANSPRTIQLNGRAYKAELAEGGLSSLRGYETQPDGEAIARDWSPAVTSGLLTWIDDSSGLLAPPVGTHHRTRWRPTRCTVILAISSGWCRTRHPGCNITPYCLI